MSSSSNVRTDPKRTIEFDRRSKAYVIRDKQAIVHAVLHNQRPVSIERATALEATERYLQTHAGLLGLDASELRNLNVRPHQERSEAGIEYRLLSEKRHFDMTTVTFQQTLGGLPVFGTGFSVHLKHRSHAFDVVSAQVSRGDTPAPAALPPPEERRMNVSPVDAETLAQLLGLSSESFDAASLRISYQTAMMYRYRAKERAKILGLVGADELDAVGMRLRPISDDIEDGSYHLVSAVYFDLPRKDGRLTHWLAMIEAKRRSVLYLEEFAAGVNGRVFLADPMTTHGGPLPTSQATNAQLNPLRVWQALSNLLETDPQALTGSNVRIAEVDGPIRPSPTRATGADFEFDVRTDEFAAVNAYYNCDRFFRFVESLGFKRDDYFPWTTFPVPIDHRGAPTQGGGLSGTGAETRGNVHPEPDGTEIKMGIKNVVFALAQPFANPPLGNANDWRVVLHELGGHGTLLNHVASTRFRFAHSAGDSFAAILNDPESNAPDKGETFPWLRDYDRWHNRTAGSGWGWDGPEDTSLHDQLHQEQILSSTHFRLYQAIGGGSPDRVDDRRFAAKYAAYLILRAIQTLTPATNPQHASDWLTNLIVADAGDWTSEGQSGGAYGKVIYWAFEKQGLFGGNPPPIDVFIDDGRAGEYTFQADYSHCPAIWNRHAHDGHQGHQAPIPHVVNYAYVKIRNRGSQAATSVVVNAFQNRSHASFDYPDDWRPMQTDRLAAPDVAAGSPGVLVGPFHWIPAAGGNRILMAVSSDGDASNLHNFGSGRAIAASRLVPTDNNLGMREV